MQTGMKHHETAGGTKARKRQESGKSKAPQGKKKQKTEERKEKATGERKRDPNNIEKSN